MTSHTDLCPPSCMSTHVHRLLPTKPCETHEQKHRNHMGDLGRGLKEQYERSASAEAAEMSGMEGRLESNQNQTKRLIECPAERG